MKRRNSSGSSSEGKKRKKKKARKSAETNSKPSEDDRNEKKKLEAELDEEMRKLQSFLKTEEDESESESESEDEDAELDYSDSSDADTTLSANIEGHNKHETIGVLHSDTYKPLQCEVLNKESKEKIESRVRSMFRTATPRPHQLDAVTCLVRDIVKTAVSKSLTDKTSQEHQNDDNSDENINKCEYTNVSEGKHSSGKEQQQQRNYLIQHAAGSGKSLTISCLACALVRLRIASAPTKSTTSSSSNSKGSGGKNVPVFEKIIIVNDRKHLDSQLGECVCAMLDANGIHSYTRVRTVAGLSEALTSGTRVIITTLQKFSSRTCAEEDRAVSLLGKLPVAIISDEAHRSHGASTTRRLHALLAGETQQAQSIVYFAFTSTPSPRSLEMFGRKKGASVQPFHTFTFPEALSAGYILDFTSNYSFISSKILIEEVGSTAKASKAATATTTVVSDGRKAAAALVAQAEAHTPFLEEKARFVVDHLLAAIAELDRPDAGLRVLAMLVVRSRRHIVWYAKYLRSLVAALPEEQQFGIIAAFSPFVYEGKHLTEASPAINEEYARFYNTKFGIVQALREKEGADIRLIVVADKLQTGFDEPRLSVLYVDKPLRGSNVVQTLGRVSRAAPGKSEVFVVDFANKKDDISAAVSMYWGVSVLEGVPPKLLLQKKLASLAGELGKLNGVYEDDLQRALVALVAEDIRRKKLGGKNRYPGVMSLFLRLCNRLQVDEESGVKYATIQRLKYAFFEMKTLGGNSEIKSLTDAVDIKFEFSKTAPAAPEALKISPDQSVFKCGPLVKNLFTFHLAFLQHKLYIYF